MPKAIEPPDYGADAFVRKVHTGGSISFKGRLISCPKAFVGRRLAIRPTLADGVFDLCYRSHVLTQIDLRQEPKTVQDVPEQAFTLSPV